MTALDILIELGAAHSQPIGFIHFECNLVLFADRLRKLVKELVDLCGEENSAKLVHQVAEQAIRISSKYSLPSHVDIKSG